MADLLAWTSSLAVESYQGSQAYFQITGPYQSLYQCALVPLGKSQ